ncbi:hypothetical protein ScPMuIL_011905 [Solemya velum]
MKYSNVVGLTFEKGSVNGKDASVLRDTGSTTVFVRRKCIDNTQLTGQTKTICLADGTERVCEEALVNIDTAYCKGVIRVLTLAEPVADIIVGNQIQSVLEHNSQDLCEAVLTRSRKAKLVAEKAEANVGLSESGFELGESVDIPELRKFGNREDLVREQKTDVSLSKCWSLARNKIRDGYAYFYSEDDILWRGFKLEGKTELRQIVIPVKWRESIMSIAHDIPMAGHLGTKRTRNRIMQHFFWPGIFMDVSRYVRSCPQCQKGIAKGRVGVAPLVSVPVMEEPFQRLAVDLVGPLNRTDRGNRYILVTCDYATKYPEAVAIKDESAETVADALVAIIARVGVPSELLSDQGSNFMSGVVKELCRLLRIRKLTSSPYHAQANGQVERFNGTLKKMLRCYAQKEPQNWDKHLPYVLFAYREVPQATTGFSPFELLYGRQVRGPLAILREEWEGPTDSSTSVLSYILEVRERLSTMSEMAKIRAEDEKQKQKFYYDRKARSRKLVVGQKALVLLPTNSNKLLAQWKGPFTVEEQTGPVDYRIKIRGKSKVFHVNMLKPWFEREVIDQKKDILAAVELLCALGDERDDEQDEICNPLLVPKETFEDIKVGPDLTVDQLEEVKHICSNYPHVLVDIPGRTDKAVHSVKTCSDKPVFQKPYPLPFALREQVEKEIENLKDAVFSDDWTCHLAHVQDVLDSLAKASLTAKPSKCEIGFTKMEFLAHIVGGGRIEPTQDKIQGIRDFPIPTSKKQVRSFLGMIGFYRKFIPNFAETAASLFDLTSKRSGKIVWGQDQSEAFEKLKKCISSSPVLRNADLSKSFVMQTDASDRGVSGVLLQEFSDEG